MPGEPVSYDSLVSLFPLSHPVPSPLTHPDLLTPQDLHREEDLLRNPNSFRAWWTALQATREACTAQQKLEGSLDVSDPVRALLGPLASPLARLNFQRLTYLYESALVHFAGSFKLWKSYLTLRMSFVCGKLVIRKRAGGKKKLPEMGDALEDELEDLEKWEGPLDPIVGWEEWKLLAATFERALMYLPKVRPVGLKQFTVCSHLVQLPRLWLMYTSIFFHPACPPNLCLTHARRTFDRALRTLPPSLHARIWTRYLLLSERKGGATAFSIYRRYLSVDSSLSERYVTILLNPVNAEPRPLEAAKLLLQLARKAYKGQYTSPEGKSPYQLLESFIDIVEKFSEQVGLDVEDTIESNKAIAKADSIQEVSESTAVDGSGASISGNAKAVDPDEDPLNPRKLNIEDIIEKDGLGVYKDQAGRLWVGLATYWLKRAEFDRAKHTFEAGLSSVLTVRDFNQIFDSYGEFGQSLMDALMESLKEEEDDEEMAETEKELDQQMKDFEELADRRPFLLNDVMIRRNSNDVQEWEKRVALWGEDDEKVAETYTQAFETINPRKATPNLHRLYISFARFYDEGGVSGKAEPDLQSARKILEKATKVNFRGVDDLAEIWCEWAEMELRHEYVFEVIMILHHCLLIVTHSNDDEAIRVMQRAAAVPKNTKVNYHDHVRPKLP
jgi:pre-mRNA-splicing factor SYF1